VVGVGDLGVSSGDFKIVSETSYSCQNFVETGWTVVPVTAGDSTTVKTCRNPEGEVASVTVDCK